MAKTQPAEKPKARTGSGEIQGSEIVSAVALARHLDCARTFIPKLEADEVFTRQPGGGFALNPCRTNYIRHLRRQRQQSLKSGAETKFLEIRTALLELRLLERVGKVVPLETHLQVVDDITGVMLTGLGSLPARIGGRDLDLRRRVETAVLEVRREISAAATKAADEQEAATDDD